MTWRINPNKYGAVKKRIDGFTFDSKAEADRYTYLKILEQAGSISDLKVHPRFRIEHNSMRICAVVLDFQYWDKKQNRHVYEDVKGVDNPMSRLKRKLLKADWGIDVVIIR